MTDPVEIVRYIFSAGGPLHASKGQHRPEQEAFAVWVMEGMMGKHKLNLVQADTGIGKTYALMIPAAVAARHPDMQDRSVIATGTISLREEMTDPATATFINDMVTAGFRKFKMKKPAPVTIAARPSHTAYPAVDRAIRLRDTLKATTITADNRLSVMHALAYCDFVIDAPKVLGRPAMFDDWLNDVASGGKLPLEMTELDLCLAGDDVRRAKTIIAEFGQKIEDAFAADIMLVTHTMLLLNNLSFSNALGTNSEKIGEDGKVTEASDRKHLVVDEADNLINLAMNFTDEMISLREIRDFLQDANVARHPSGAKASTLLSGIEADLERVYPNDIRRRRPQSLTEVLRTDYVDFVQRVAELTTALVEIGQGGDFLVTLQVERFTRPLTNLTNLLLLSGLTRMDSLKFEWTSARLFVDAHYADRTELRIGTKPIEGHNLVNRIWMSNITSFETITMASATLSSASQSFLNFKMRVGIFEPKDTPGQFKNGDLIREETFTVQNFGRVRNIYYGASDLPKPSLDEADFNGPATGENTSGASYDNPVYLDYVAKVAEHAHSQGGRTLVLLSSSHSLLAIEKLLIKRGLGNKLHVQHKGMKTKALMRQFAQTNDGLWLGLKWAGENFVDQQGASLLARVIIGKIPFGIANPVREAGKYAMMNAIEDGMRIFRQGIGRGIRNQTDEIDVWICDPRYPKPDGLGWAKYPDKYNNEYFKRNSGGMIPERFLTGRFAAKSHLITLKNNTLGTSLPVRKPKFSSAMAGISPPMQSLGG